MDTNPLISIIVPVYNVEKYLRRCLNSIINQTYEQIEIILVNDGSTDRSIDICYEYQNIDHRITVVCQSNKGLSQARNTGIEASQGEYISFIDSDDYVHPRCIEFLYRAIVDNNVDMSVCHYKKVDHQIEYFNHDYISCVKSTYSIFTEMFTPTYGIFITVWGALYHKKIWNTLRFPIGKIHEDEFVYHLIYSQMINIAYVDIPLYYYFQNEQSLSQKNGKLISHPDCLEAFENRLNFFQVIDHNIAVIIQKQLLYCCIYFYNISPKKEYHEKFIEFFDYNITKELTLKIRMRYIIFFISPKLYTIIKTFVQGVK